MIALICIIIAVGSLIAVGTLLFLKGATRHEETMKGDEWE
ncbi:MAG: hypothetical protein ACFWTY_01125 [Shouchella clausii]|jgi:hypothetical protein